MAIGSPQTETTSLFSLPPAGISSAGILGSEARNACCSAFISLIRMSFSLIFSPSSRSDSVKAEISPFCFLIRGISADFVLRSAFNSSVSCIRRRLFSSASRKSEKSTSNPRLASFCATSSGLFRMYNKSSMCPSRHLVLPVYSNTAPLKVIRPFPQSPDRHSNPSILLTARPAHSQ